MRELTQEEIGSVGGSVSVGGHTQDCSGFLWYLATGMICCSGHCYQY